MTVRIAVRVTPRGGRDEVGEFDDADVLHVRVTAPPADGQANEQVVRVIARALGVPRRDVVIVGGHRGRDKRVELPFATLAAVRAHLARRR